MMALNLGKYFVDIGQFKSGYPAMNWGRGG